METEQCPKCESHWFDGDHCLSCGYYKPFIPNVKHTRTAPCKNCGKEVTIHEFYGWGDSNDLSTRINILCEDCYAFWNMDINIREMNFDYGRIKMTKKRFQQYKNFQDWCEGRI
jgi:hypothetical protein